MRYSKGFTLVEMLVAGVIMMAVLLIASSGYSFFADRWQSDNQSYRHNLAQKRTQLMVMDVLKGVLPYLTRVDGLSFYFFDGDNQEMMAVTANPIFGHQPAVFQLKVKEDDDGTLSIIYREAPLVSRMSVDGKLPDFKYEKVMLEGLTLAGFRFFGWRSQKARVSYLDTGEGGLEWMDTFNGDYSGSMPYAIGITLDQEGNAFRVILPHDESELRSYSSEVWGDV